MNRAWIAVFATASAAAACGGSHATGGGPSAPADGAPSTLDGGGDVDGAAPATSADASGAATEASYDVPLVPSSAYDVYVRVGGGAPHAVQLDTGSTGLYYPAQHLGPDAKITSETCSITYVSSGNVLSGHRALAKVEFLGSTSSAAPTPIPTTVEMPLCAVDNFNGGMMGIGYGRGTTTPDQNAALQIAEMKQGTMRPGYVLSTRPALHVVLGITTAMKRSFNTIALTADSSIPGQWLSSSLVGCLEIPKYPSFGAPCGPLLVDTGIADCLLWGPADPTLGGLLGGGQTTAPAGVSMTIRAQADPSALAYSFVTGDPAAPAAVTVRSASKFSINTGRRLLLSYDYLFDAASGEVGFRPAAP